MLVEERFSPLIRAGKRFDMLVLPGGGHVYSGPTFDHFLWKRADFFNRHLLGGAPDSVDVGEMMSAPSGGRD